MRTRKAKHQKKYPEQQPWNWYAVNWVLSKVPITFTPHADVAPEAELDVLVAIYRFVLTESEASKKIAEQALSPTATTPTEACKDGKEVAMT
jgi:hypothetical protein